MISRNDLPELLYNTIKELGGKADMMTIFKKFYHDNEQLLKKSGDLFYTWNYDIRWAATKLRKTIKCAQLGNGKIPTVPIFLQEEFGKL